MKKVSAKKQIKKETITLDVLAVKVDTLSTRVDTVVEKIDLLSARVDTVVEKVDTLSTTVDTLARLMIEGFEKADKRFEQIDRRFEYLEHKVDNGFFNVHQELKDHRERLERIEFAKNMTEGSKDSVVYRSELKLLAKRVTALEKKK